MLRGNHSAKIDDKGRLKIPNAFRALVEEQHGAALFVTSLTGESVRIYPMPIWLGVEERLRRMPSTHPARLKFLDHVNYFGQLGLAVGDTTNRQVPTQVGNAIDWVTVAAGDCHSLGIGRRCCPPRASLTVPMP